jgi:hypothetical protein
MLCTKTVPTSWLKQLLVFEITYDHPLKVRLQYVYKRHDKLWDLLSTSCVIHMHNDGTLHSSARNKIHAFFLKFAFLVSMCINTGPGRVSEERLGILSSPPSAIKWQQWLVYCCWQGQKTKYYGFMLFPLQRWNIRYRRVSWLCKASLCSDMKAVFFNRLAFLLCVYWQLRLLISSSNLMYVVTFLVWILSKYILPVLPFLDSYHFFCTSLIK